ncbi:MAG: RNA polymerase sigma factor [Clostridia bacterium]|nr:RNA polymerase sigma factor [Clostridia bacterium]
MTDREIVELFLARDERGIREAQKQYGKKLKNIARNLGLSEQDAEEIENDAYLSAWKSIPPHAPYDYLFSYLSKIVRESSINRLRKLDAQKRNAVWVELTSEMEECIAAPEESALEAKQLAEAVNGFLKTLPAEQRIVFLRRYWFFDSPDTIARQYGHTSGKVRSMLFRIRLKLRAYLRKEGLL